MEKKESITLAIAIVILYLLFANLFNGIIING
jgi:hypothetical protein